MNKKRFSPRDVLLVLFLALLVIGLTYYMSFYTPLQAELKSLSDQISEAESQFNTASARLSTMNTMQAELDAILALPEDQITEIAPYDNKEVVLQLLNGILAETQYNLSFADPTIQEDGTVRRNVNMSFSCETYDNAKDILESLDKCQWRCLISNLSISGSNDVLNGPVSVSATITFFESLNLTPAAPSPEELEEEEEEYEALIDDEELRESLRQILEFSMGSGDSAELSANGVTDRAMIVATLWRLEGRPEPEHRGTFSDVEEDAWYAEAVEWAAEQNLVTGFDNEFRPLNAVTRDEINTILFRFAAYKGIDNITEYLQGYITTGENPDVTDAPAEDPASTDEPASEEPAAEG